MVEKETERGKCTVVHCMRNTALKTKRTMDAFISDPADCLNMTC